MPKKMGNEHGQAVYDYAKKRFESGEAPGFGTFMKYAEESENLLVALDKTAAQADGIVSREIRRQAKLALASIGSFIHGYEQGWGQRLEDDSLKGGKLAQRSAE